MIAADQDAVARGRLADVQDRGQRQAGGHLDHGGMRGGAAHAEQDGAGLVHGADRGETLRSQQREYRELGERGGVGQQGGQVVHADVAGQDLGSRRDCPLAVDGADPRP